MSQRVVSAGCYLASNMTLNTRSIFCVSIGIIKEVVVHTVLHRNAQTALCTSCCDGVVLMCFLSGLQFLELYPFGQNVKFNRVFL